MQHRLVTMLGTLTGLYACHVLRKVSGVNDLCHSHRSLRFFVLLAVLCLSVPQYVVALSSGEIIAVSSMQDSWPQLGMAFPSWNGDPSTACNPAWSGLNCDASESIITIMFSSAGLPLVGTIPPELGNLASLQYLYLDINQLSGTIPPELGNLASLRYLSLSYNQLSGTIPPELGNLASLQTLYLDHNQLSGTIAPVLGNLASLQQLHLYSNQLSGTIPPVLGNLASLQQLSLYYNQLDGTIPPELGNLASLQTLYLYNNQLSGPIPPQLGNLASLLDLFLHSNQLSGTIPPVLGNLASLHQLNLDNNQLIGTIPPVLRNLAFLQYLYLYNNQLSGAFPMELLHLPSLNTLDVSSNDLSLCPPTNSTSFTPSSSLSSCNLNSQSPDCGDAQCSAFYSSLRCSVNFDICPTIPVTPVVPSVPPDTPVAPPVTDAPDTPATSPDALVAPPVSSVTPVAPPVTDAPDTPATSPVPPPDPPFSCPSQTPPGPSFSCINGVWTSNGNVSGVTIQISSPASIEGDLDLSNTVTFVGLDGSLSVDGCVNIEGIEIVLSDEDVEMIKKSSKGKQSLELLKQGKTTGCATLDSIPLSVKHLKSCTKVSASRDPSTSTHSSLSVIFKVNSTNCHLWWIIFLSVIGGIVVIILVFVLLATFNTRVKEKVRPFWLPNTQMQGAYRYADD